MLKYFQDIETNDCIAINPNFVRMVIDHTRGPKIVFNDGSYYFVDGEYLNAVARLNERD